MADSIRVRVSAWGSAAEAIGRREQVLELPAGATLALLIARLETDYPRLAAAAGRVRFALNEKYAQPDAPLTNGDEVALIPPVSGGSTGSVRLVQEAIDVAALIAEVSDARCGAISTFLGIVRHQTNAAGAPLTALEYTAHASMALTEMQRICDDARTRFGLHEERLVHRLGVLKIGEASVVVVTSAPHRAAACDGCRAIVEEFKQRVPIFKRERWKDGATTWVDGI